MKVLVHFDSYGQTPYGLWYVRPDTGQLCGYYVREDSPEAARGRVLVYNKTNPEVSWSEWFDHLTTRQPYFEQWYVYDSMGMTPAQMLDALRPTQISEFGNGAAAS